MTYTEQEFSSLGRSAEELAAAGVSFTTLTVDVQNNDRVICEDDQRGFARVHYGKVRRILGVTIVAAEAGKLLTGLTLAMTHNLSLGDIVGTIFPSPTRSELLKRLADSYNRRRLTPTAAIWLKRVLRWRR